MQLKFHQRTFDLLTSTRIDPQKAVKVFEEYEGPFTYKHNVETHGEEYARQKVQEWRETVLPWTKLDLYLRPVRFSDENIHQLDELERKHNIKLPASVREWYSLDIAPEIMSVWDAGGYPPIYRRIEALGPVPQTTCDIYGVEYRHDMWDFLRAEYVEQGGENIVLQVGTEDDPPVFALLHDGYELLEPSFSQFIYMHFWGWFTRYLYSEVITIYPDQLLGPPSKYWLPLQRFRVYMSELRFNSRHYFFNDGICVSTYSPQSKDEAAAHSGLVAGGSFKTNDIERLRKLFVDLWGEFDAPVFYMIARGNTVGSLVDDLQRRQLIYLMGSAPSEWVTTGYLVDELSSPDSISPSRGMLITRINHQLEKLSAFVELDEAGAEDKHSLAVRYRLRP